MCTKFKLKWKHNLNFNFHSCASTVKTVKSASSAVSIWRTYFVANEWNEIQTHRKTNPVFNILISLFLLSYVGFGNWATSDPRRNYHLNDPSHYHAPMSCWLRFALIAPVYLLTGVSARPWLVSTARRWA